MTTFPLFCSYTWSLGRKLGQKHMSRKIWRLKTKTRAETKNQYVSRNRWETYGNFPETRGAWSESPNIRLLCQWWGCQWPWWWWWPQEMSELFRNFCKSGGKCFQLEIPHVEFKVAPYFYRLFKFRIQKFWDVMILRIRSRAISSAGNWLSWMILQPKKHLVFCNKKNNSATFVDTKVAPSTLAGGTSTRLRLGTFCRTHGSHLRSSWDDLHNGLLKVHPRKN